MSSTGRVLPRILVSSQSADLIERQLRDPKLIPRSSALLPIFFKQVERGAKAQIDRKYNDARTGLQGRFRDFCQKFFPELDFNACLGSMPVRDDPNDELSNAPSYHHMLPRSGSAIFNQVSKHVEDLEKYGIDLRYNDRVIELLDLVNSDENLYIVGKNNHKAYSHYQNKYFPYDSSSVIKGIVGLFPIPRLPIDSPDFHPHPLRRFYYLPTAYIDALNSLTLARGKGLPSSVHEAILGLETHYLLRSIRRREPQPEQKWLSTDTAPQMGSPFEEVSFEEQEDKPPYIIEVYKEHVDTPALPAALQTAGSIVLSQITSVNPKNFSNGENTPFPEGVSFHLVRLGAGFQCRVANSTLGITGEGKTIEEAYTDLQTKFAQSYEDLNNVNPANPNNNKLKKITVKVPPGRQFDQLKMQAAVLGKELGDYILELASANPKFWEFAQKTNDFLNPGPKPLPTPEEIH